MELIKISTIVHKPLEEVWHRWNNPRDIEHWNTASSEWHTPKATLTLQPGASFSYRMEAKDGSMGFDFSGKYLHIAPYKQIKISLDDGRKLEVNFEKQSNDKTQITEIFEPENQNPVELQKQGWQAILNNFKSHVEKMSDPVMERVVYDIIITATPSEIFKTLIHPDHYRQWTAVFHPTSRYEGEWKKNAQIKFIATKEDGTVAGMVSKIKEIIPNEYISIEHIATFEGEKITPQNLSSFENYYLDPRENGTLFSVEMDVFPEWKEYFKSTWPAALNKLKSIVEK